MPRDIEGADVERRGEANRHNRILATGYKAAV